MALKSGKSGRDQYASHYEEHLEQQAEWLKLGARQKADSVIKLLQEKNLRPEKLLELGSGTGAVLSILQHEEVAQVFYAVDFSKDAIEYLKGNLPNVHAEVADIMDKPDVFGKTPFDLVLLTHTLEHLEQPSEFLRRVADIPMDHLIVEVPLEDLVFGRLKSAIVKRSKHPAGHVQFYNWKSFRETIESSGYEIVGQRIYAPVLSRSAITNTYSSGRKVKLVYKYLTEFYFPKYLSGFWKRFYHAHMAVLCRKRPQVYTPNPLFPQ